MSIMIKRIRPDARIPEYKTAGSAGFDLRACIDKPIQILAGQIKRVPTGIAIWVDNPQYALKLYIRSGVAANGVSLANSVGLVDSDYQGEIILLVQNNNRDATVTIDPQDRIAQGVFEPVAQGHFVEVAEFPLATERGAGGFGSTGLR